MKTATKILIACCAVVMALIFFMSSEDATSSENFSDSITRIILNVIEPGMHEKDKPKAAKTSEAD